MTSTKSLAPHLRSQPIAAWRHTAIVIVIFLATGLLGLQHARPQTYRSPHHVNMAPIFLIMISVEWALVYYVSKWGLGPAGYSWRSVAGQMLLKPRDLSLDVLIALGAFITWMLVEGIGQTFMRGQHSSIENLIPHAPLELSLWVCVSVTAGICEEFIFRGYLQHQFLSLTGVPVLALLLQSVIFGATHLYQGIASAFLTLLAGLIFGVVAMWRRSLRPGMIAHALSDLVPILIFATLRH